MAQQTWECRLNVSKIFNSRFSIFKGAQSFILARIQGAYNDVYMHITENSKWFDFSEHLSAMTGLQREMANGFQDTR